METNVYDLAGRLTFSTDAAGNVTTYSESTAGGGGLLRTTTHAHGARIELLHRDGQLMETGGSAAHLVKMQYTAASGEVSTKEIRVGIGGSEAEWTQTVNDMAGRTIRVEYAGGAVEHTHYDSATGRRIKHIDADEVTRLYAAGVDWEEEAIDLNANGATDAADRRTRTERSVASGTGGAVYRTTRLVGDNSGYTAIHVMDETPGGLWRQETHDGLATTTVTVLDGSGGWTETTTRPDGSTASRSYVNGRLVSSQDANGGTTFGYDGDGRVVSETDLRSGTVTTTTWHPGDLPHVVTKGILTTTYSAYNSQGLATLETRPGGATVERTYLPTGELASIGGTAEYPVSFTYDPQGRRKTMTTSTGTTTWNYDALRGWLVEKIHADNTSTSYTHTPAGRPVARTGGRGIVTTYVHNAAGDLSSVAYSDSTPGHSFTYDLRGRIETVTDATGIRTLTYGPGDQPGTETSGSGLVLSNSYDGLHRRSAFSATLNSEVLASDSFDYDTASRLASVSGNGLTAVYSRLANSRLVNDVAFSMNGNPAMTTAKTHDALDRLTAVTNTPETGSALIHAYQHDSAGRRERATKADGSYWQFGYNDRSEVVFGAKQWPDDTPVSGMAFGYAFDGIGNRVSSTTNGRAATWTPNNVNQYTSRTVSGAVDIFGLANENATVSVNGKTPGKGVGPIKRFLRAFGFVISSEIAWHLRTKFAKYFFWSCIHSAVSIRHLVFSFIAAGYMRRGAFTSVTRREWGIFLGSWLIGNGGGSDALPTCEHRCGILVAWQKQQYCEPV